MDLAMEKRCLMEISFLVLDSKETVTLKSMSNNFSITNEAVNSLFERWLVENHEIEDDLELEFLVRGRNGKGVFCISVVSARKYAIIEKTWAKYSSFIYSIALTSDLRKSLLPDITDIKIKRILLQSAEVRTFPHSDAIQRTTEITSIHATDRKIQPSILQGGTSLLKVTPMELLPKMKSAGNFNITTKVQRKQKGFKNQPVLKGKGAITAFLNNEHSLRMQFHGTAVDRETPSDVRSIEKGSDVTMGKRVLITEQGITPTEHQPSSKKIKLSGDVTNQSSASNEAVASGKSHVKQPQVKNPKLKFKAAITGKQENITSYFKRMSKQ